MAFTKIFQYFILFSTLAPWFLPNYSFASHGIGQIASSFNRMSFPSDFLFGAGVSAYQTEGSPLKYGRGASNWDVFIKQYPDRIADGSSAEVATDFYHKYKDDIQMAKNIGLDTFRFSISWSRVIPSGMIKNGVNDIGVNFYNNVIDEIISSNMKPFVTLYHMDTPQALEEDYGGPLSSNFVNDFKDYADFCFKTFGDRVKLWTTINEPNLVSRLGYAAKEVAPGRCSLVDGDCTAGDSATEPYIVAHNFLLAHATAATLYKTQYQGEIGMNMGASYYHPLANTGEDVLAVSRALDFDFGRILHPLTFGDYPESLKRLVGKRLPNFTEEQSKLLISSKDFITLNYYTSYYAYDIPYSKNITNLSINTDGQFGFTGFKNDVPIGDPTASSMFFEYPKGLYELLVYIREKYNNTPIYIAENGYASNNSLPFKQAINDWKRVSFISCHLKYIVKAIDNGCNVKGYSMWSLINSWEWAYGFTLEYGLIHVELVSLKRYFRVSALWYKNFLLHNNTDFV